MLELLGVAMMASVGAAEVWTPHPLDKVLSDAQPPEGAASEIALDLAANEYEGAQIAIRNDDDAIAALMVSASPLAPAEGADDALPVEVFLVETVPLTHGSPAAIPEAEGDLIAKPPARVPDPIPPWPDGGVDVPAGQTRCAYIRVRTPAGTPAGEYEGVVSLRWEGGEAEARLRVRVWPVEIPAERHLQYTNWVSHDAFAKHHGVEVWSDAYYEVVSRYAREAHEHRQTMMWTPTNIIRVIRDADGDLRCDFTQLDRWIEMCIECGVGDRIELTPLGGCDRELGTIPLSNWSVDDGATGGTVSLSATDALPEVLPALEEHLRERGWLERTMLHIADEPFLQSVEAYRETADWLRSLAPGLRRIEAIEAPEFGDSLEVWVPKLTHYYHWMDTYQAAQKRGVEMWFYTCCHPHPPFPNRFLDQPLVATRVLHWINWRYAMPGYLHWGLNFWDDNPWESAGNPGLPPGDCWVVYPGEDGPVSSLRYEAVRDGIEDYELLWLLTESTRELLGRLGAPEGAFDPARRSDELAAEAVPTIIDWPRDPQVLLDLRRAALEEIAALPSGPLLYVETDPATYRALTPGPIAVGVRGITEPGVEVTVNGERVFPQNDGTFVAHIFPPNPPTIEVVARDVDGEKRMVRRWPVARPTRAL